MISFLSHLLGKKEDLSLEFLQGISGNADSGLAITWEFIH